MAVAGLSLLPFLPLVLSSLSAESVASVLVLSFEFLEVSLDFDLEASLEEEGTKE